VSVGQLVTGEEGHASDAMAGDGWVRRYGILGTKT